MSRQDIHARATLGQRLADRVASAMGSWWFVIVQSGIVVSWIGVNLWLLSRPFDPWPFILLNLLFSTQAAYASPLILMSQNRQAQKDRWRDDLEAQEVEQIFENHKETLRISKQLLIQQMDILARLKR